jgi:uncharacterized protein
MGVHHKPIPHSANLPIQREERPSKGRYYVRLDGMEAQMTYSRAGDTTIIIDHTEVPDASRGGTINHPALSLRVTPSGRTC